jgi:hypothetical protein
MFFDIGIGIHIESQLNMFRFVNDISSKMEVFPVSEIWVGRNFMQNSNFMHTCIMNSLHPLGIFSRWAYEISFAFDIFLHSPLLPSDNGNQSGLRNALDKYANLLFQLVHHLGTGPAICSCRQPKRSKSQGPRSGDQIDESGILSLFAQPFTSRGQWRDQNADRCDLRAISACWDRGSDRIL